MLGTFARRSAVGGLATLVGLTALMGPANATSTDPVPTAQAGTIVTWGPGVSADQAPPNGIAPPTLPAAYAGTAFKQVVTSGPTTGLGLTTDGKVVLLGTPVFQMPLPTAALANTVVTQITADDTEGAIAVTADGHVIAWSPQDASGIADIPSGLSDVASVQIAVNESWGAAVKTNGTVVAWGDDGSGQTDVPAGLTGVTALSLGGSGAYALKSDGTVVGWGQESSQTLPAVLTDTIDDLDVTSVVDRNNGGLALLSDGSVVVWGTNTSANHDGSTYNDLPADLTGKTVTAIAATQTVNMAVDSAGAVYAWGQTPPLDPAYGQPPAEVAGSQISSISMNDYFVAAVMAKVLEVTKPTIAGTAKQGTELTATPATFSGAPDTVTGQWYAAGTKIDGATETTYTPTTADVNKTLTYRSTATTGSEPPVTSESGPTAAVAPYHPVSATTHTRAKLRNKANPMRAHYGKNKHLASAKVHYYVSTNGNGKAVGKIRVNIFKGHGKFLRQKNRAYNGPVTHRFGLPKGHWTLRVKYMPKPGSVFKASQTTVRFYIAK